MVNFGRYDQLFYNLYQVLIMNNKKKKYVGSFADEKDAAVLYDKVAILTHGLKVSISYYPTYQSLMSKLQAKTNFGYNKNQLMEILKENINMD